MLHRGQNLTLAGSQGQKKQLSCALGVQRGGTSDKVGWEGAA